MEVTCHVYEVMMRKQSYLSWRTTLLGGLDTAVRCFLVNWSEYSYQDLLTRYHSVNYNKNDQHNHNNNDDYNSDRGTGWCWKMTWSKWSKFTHIVFTHQWRPKLQKCMNSRNGWDPSLSILLTGLCIVHLNFFEPLLSFYRQRQFDEMFIHTYTFISSNWLFAVIRSHSVKDCNIVLQSATWCSHQTTSSTGVTDSAGTNHLI